MTDAPKKIWALPPDIFDNMSVWQDSPSNDNAEVGYLRAALAETEGK